MENKYIYVMYVYIYTYIQIYILWSISSSKRCLKHIMRKGHSLVNGARKLHIYVYKMYVDRSLTYLK